MSDDVPSDPELDLVLVREVDVAPELVWRAWTTPALLLKWFTPQPWETVECDIDLRPGGAFRTVMRSPEGVVQPASTGCFLEIVPNRLLTWTDAMCADYRPNEKPFMTATIRLEPTASGTRYTAHVRHATAEACKAHEEMGFEGGWGTALEQLVALAKTL